MAGKGAKVFTAGSNSQRKVTFNTVPTKQLNHRRVFVAKKDITLNARFSMLKSMRQHASQQQSVGRDSLLAKKRGLKSSEAPSQDKGGSKSGRKIKKKGIAVSPGVKVRPTAVGSHTRKKGKQRKGKDRAKE
ncbi:g11730 [Coccomyxa viridis]|uniref:G11730 protein n=1 Tax=Coccomyxa viridis TaxID=1274662 RepID=A0ABP1GD14_9CHLO